MDILHALFSFVHTWIPAIVLDRLLVVLCTYGSARALYTTSQLRVHWAFKRIISVLVVAVTVGLLWATYRITHPSDFYVLINASPTLDDRHLRMSWEAFCTENYCDDFVEIRSSYRRLQDLSRRVLYHYFGGDVLDDVEYWRNPVFRKRHPRESLVQKVLGELLVCSAFMMCIVLCRMVTSSRSKGIHAVWWIWASYAIIELYLTVYTALLSRPPPSSLSHQLTDVLSGHAALPYWMPGLMDFIRMIDPYCIPFEVVRFYHMTLVPYIRILFYAYWSPTHPSTPKDTATQRGSLEISAADDLLEVDTMEESEVAAMLAQVQLVLE